MEQMEINDEPTTPATNPTDIASTADKMQVESTHPGSTSKTMTTESSHTLEPPLNESKEKPSSKENAATSSKCPLDGWTKDEKYELYVAIKSKGSKRINEIHKSIPTKSIDEIQEAISYYRTKARGDPECATKKLNIRKAKNKPYIPLADWAKVLMDNFDYDELQTETVTALRMIADLEDIPEPLYTENIDFRKIYHQIADAMEGKAVQDDKLIAQVLHNCVLETALVGKSFLKPSTYKRILSTVKIMKEREPVFARPTMNKELSLIRHLVSLKNYNPLNIKEDYLVPSATRPFELDSPDEEVFNP